MRSGDLPRHPAGCEYDESGAEDRQQRQGAAGANAREAEVQVVVETSHVHTRVLVGWLRADGRDDNQHGSDRDRHSKSSCENRPDASTRLPAAGGEEGHPEPQCAQREQEPRRYEEKQDLRKPQSEGGGWTLPVEHDNAGNDKSRQACPNEREPAQDQS